MSIDTIVVELKAERDRINHAINALDGLSANGAATTHAVIQAKKRGGITAAGRKRISEMMKARWAAKRKKVKSKS